MPVIPPFLSFRKAAGPHVKHSFLHMLGFFHLCVCSDFILLHPASPADIPPLAPHASVFQTCSKQTCTSWPASTDHAKRLQAGRQGAALLQDVCAPHLSIPRAVTYLLQPGRRWIKQGECGPLLHLQELKESTHLGTRMGLLFYSPAISPSENTTFSFLAPSLSMPAPLHGKWTLGEKSTQLNYVAEMNNYAKKDVVGTVLGTVQSVARSGQHGPCTLGGDLGVTLGLGQFPISEGCLGLGFKHCTGPLSKLDTPWEIPRDPSSCTAHKARFCSHLLPIGIAPMEAPDLPTKEVWSLGISCFLAGQGRSAQPQGGFCGGSAHQAGMPSRGTRTGSRSGPMGTLLSSPRPSARS